MSFDPPSFRQACDLVEVCRRWTAIFMGDDEIWSHHEIQIGNGYHLPKMLSLLRRGNPRTVHLGMPGQRDWLSRPDAHHIGRLRDMTIILSDYAADIRDLSIDLLRGLTTDDIQFLFRVNGLSGLTKLEIRQPRPGTRALLPLPHHLLSLRSLSLVEVKMHPDVRVSLRPYLVDLPNLESLQLVDCTNLPLLCDETDKNEPPLELLRLLDVDLLRQHDTGIENGPGQPPKVVASWIVAPRLRSLKLDQCQWDYRGLFFPVDGQANPSALRELLYRPPGEEDRQTLAVTLVSQLSRAPLLEELYLSERPDLGIMLQALTVRAGTEPPLCPMLKLLDLGGAEVHTTVLEAALKSMVRSRIQVPESQVVRLNSLNMINTEFPSDDVYKWLDDSLADFRPARKSLFYKQVSALFDILASVNEY